MTQILIFHILCKYFIIKIEDNNHKIVSSLKTRNNHRFVRHILHSFDRIFREIDEYNRTYWSKYLFILYVCYGIIAVNMLYITIFAPFKIYHRIFAAYITVIIVVFYLFFMSIVSSVNLRANKLYKLY